jgi:DNA-binding XRE family transcriptional regulator
MYTNNIRLWYKEKTLRCLGEALERACCLISLWPLGSLQWPLFEFMEEIQKALGSRIRELRKEKGFSQGMFARRCGLHPSYMGEIERGETNLTLASLIVIAKKLRTTISDLFESIA